MCVKITEMCKPILFLLLFQKWVLWTNAMPSLADEHQLGERVRDSIRNFIHSGIYTHTNLDPTQTELTFPVKVASDGAFLSHDVSHNVGSEARRRRRRSADDEHKEDHSLHYNITVAGRDLRLDLRPSLSFINPSLVVERHTKNGRSRTILHQKAESCHFKGKVRGDDGSSVAVSACDGMTGLLRTNYGEYWIEPSNFITEDPNEPRPHIVFKRSHVSKDHIHHHTKRSIDKKEERRYVNDYLEDRRRIHNKNFIVRHKKVSNDPSQNSNQRYRNIDPPFRPNKTEYRSYESHRNISFNSRLNRPESRDNNPVNKINAYQTRNNSPSARINRLDRVSRPNSNKADAYSINKNYGHNNSTLMQSRRVNDLANKRQKSSERSMEKKMNRSKEKLRKSHIKKKRRRRLRRNCGTKEPKRTALLQWTQGTGDFETKRRLAASRSRLVNKRRTVQPPQARSHEANRMANRGRRSISKPRHVEVLLAADPTMTQFHERGGVETYLLTIMNMVSGLYLDPTIGNFIEVVVVKIILLEEDTDELKVSTNSDATLSAFCSWQHKINPPDDQHPNHHDVAILITRMDLCSNKDMACSTLGVAHVGGMCQPYKSCSVNEDNGITLAHTITHELGHNFGLYHDTEKIGCHRRVGSTLHIMTPIFEADTVTVAWSRCSRRDVTNFLDAGMGDCLGDTPTQANYLYPELPPGALFDAAKQCRLQFGNNATTVCNTDGEEFCRQLWCQVNGACLTMLRPAADGTECGNNMWCQKNACVPRAPAPAAVDGGWGEWGHWGACSRTCGGGVSVQARYCDSPPPSHGGKFCIGERSRYKVCNTTPCPRNEPSFRQVQCSKYDNTEYENKTIPTWIPYLDQEEPCELYCTTPNQSKIVPFGDYAQDGTPCNTGTKDMCISGICRKIGCDWIVDSNVTEDACGICGGDGSACKTVQGIYSKGNTKESGFSEVAIIPAGSRNVKVEEIANSKNYIGIGSAQLRKFYLNGKRKITPGSEYFVAGSRAVYERDRDWEKVIIPGPIKEDIKIYQMIYRGKHRNPGVTYQYTVDRTRAEKPIKTPTRVSTLKTSASSCRWIARGWTQCSATCGGTRRNIIQCIDDSQNVVSDECCVSQEYQSKPSDMVESCSSPCPSTRWWPGTWSACNVPCRTRGVDAFKRRSVYCVDKGITQVLSETSCDAPSKPAERTPCIDLPPC